MPSVVYLTARVPESHPSAAVLGQERMGTGVAVASDRVLTAHYLLLGASEVALQFPDGRERAVARVIADHDTGLGLLCLDGPPLRPLELSPEPARPGLPVFLLAASGPDERKGATGHVTAIAPFEAFWEYMLDRAILTTVVNPGLSGAPLCDAAGRLLGVVSLGLAAVARYSLAIPADLYLAHRAEMLGERRRTRPRRAWIGFYPHGSDGSIVLTGVVPGGPAEQAGLAQGDLLLSVDGRVINSLRELYREIWRKGPGEGLRFQVLREESLRVFDVTAGDREEFYR